MRGRPGVLGRLCKKLLRKVGREALVEGDDRDVGHTAERLDEALGLERLLAPFTAECERQADDDSADFLLTDQRRYLGEPFAAARTLDNAERPRDRPGGIAHRNTGAGPAVVEREDLHFRAAAIAFFPA